MRCTECRNGEHEDYDDDIRVVVVIDPETGKGKGKKIRLCREHRTAMRDDGYSVEDY